MAELSISHTEDDNGGAFFVEQDGKRVAELTYSRANAELAIIEHTEVADRLRGEGLGRRLVDAAVLWARDTHTKIRSSCSFASAQFADDPSIRDVLA